MKSIKTLTTTASLTALQLLAAPLSAFATTQEDLCRGSGGTPSGSGATFACAPPGGGPGVFDEGGVFRNVVNVLIFLVGAISVIMLVVGAIRYVVSGGDPAGTKGAKDTILYAIIGIVVAAAAFGIVTFVIGSVSG
jgi:hypothetical protein